MTDSESYRASRLAGAIPSANSRLAWWPYLLFGLLVTAYLVLTLGDGFAPTLDEGFLQSNAQRLLNGERLYHDFQYWRTPYSIYFQALLIWLLGDSYTILAARIICALQLIGIIVLLSITYRRSVSALELFFLLVGSYVGLSMLLTFPWYSYDALMFAVIAVVLAVRRRLVFAGLAAAFAGLAKQNYFLLLPLLLVLLGLLWVVDHRLKPFRWKEIGKTLLGFAAPLFLYTAYLWATGDLAEFYHQLVVYPARTNPLPWTTAVFQDGTEALRRTLPFILLFGLLYLAGRRKWMMLPLVVATAYFFASGLSTDVRFAVYLLLAFNVTAALLAWSRWDRKPEGEFEGNAGILVMLFFGLAIQYLSGYNYGGLIFAQMGGAIAFPFAYVALKNLAPDRGAKWVVIVTAITLISVLAVHKYKYVYHEGKRQNLTTPFSTPKLVGVSSTPRMVKHVEAVLAAIDRYCPPDSLIFTYPNYPSLYFLTGRRNPTDIDWYYNLDQNPSLVEQSLRPLLTNPPSLILISTDKLPPLLSTFLLEQYRPVEQIADVQLYVRKSDNAIAAIGERRMAPDASTYPGSLSGAAHR